LYKEQLQSVLELLSITTFTMRLSIKTLFLFAALLAAVAHAEDAADDTDVDNADAAGTPITGKLTFLLSF
jgi:hypothetical protein